jgi:DNA-binding NtrC family response regulator
MQLLETSYPEKSTAVVASSNPKFLKSISERLEPWKWNTQFAQGGAEALEMVEGAECPLLFLDRRLEDLEVSELVQIVKQRYPHTKVIVLECETGDLRVVESLSYPAAANLDLFKAVMNSAQTRMPGQPASERALERRSSAVMPIIHEPLPDMVGASETMQRVYNCVRLVTRRDTTVLITGETGTGKELVASAIHRLSPRSGKPFVTVNCAAIPESLLESELFGYARGAFTGAFQSRLGRIHAAHEGTLLLDEIGELPLGMQAKLLRFLEEGEVQRLGSSDVFRVDVRVLASTNSNLIRSMAEGRFREDLYYRLAVFPVDVPPLRERLDDILSLTHHFLERHAADAGVPAKTVSPEAAELLLRHNWPGNVRELQHVVERAFILSDKETVIQPGHLSLRRRPEFSQRNLTFAA